MRESRHLITGHGLTAHEFDSELHRILDYWSDVVFDKAGGRFHPKVDNENRAYDHVASGSVMYARILWAFSAGYRHTGSLKYRDMADTAYRYISQHFVDTEYGGVYWSVHPDKSPADSKKQIYALAFTIYGLAEYVKINADHAVLTLAKALYRCIEQYSTDPQYGGYIEALSRDWAPTDQLRLSAKDGNEKKTLNTHLHILEAYTNLYGVWPDAELKEKIVGLLHLFQQHFVDQRHGHLLLFFDEQWHPKSTLQSFGHDIEASWLIAEAAHLVYDGQLPDGIRTLALKLAKAAAEGIDERGALLYEYDPTNRLIAEKHWWVQAEAVVGFYRAGLLAADPHYLALAVNAWQYITRYMVDRKNGEWYWGRDEHGLLIDQEDKAGFWKCPYHNSRCCLEMIALLG